MGKTYSGFTPDLHTAKLPTGTRFAYAGYWAAPRKGQWYISGAVPCAYRAPNDLTQAYAIAYAVAPGPTFIEKNPYYVP